MGKSHLITGQKGEEIAEKYLRKKWYKILGRNVKTCGGEVDLIAKQGDTIVFVEVKTKTRDDAIAPSERVNWAKIQRLRRAAQAWIDGEFERSADDISGRIDVIGVCEGEVVEHYEDVTA